MRRLGSFCVAGRGAWSCMSGQAQTRQRLNPMIDLLEQKKPLFGVYWPGNPQGRRGGPPPADAVMKPPADWAKDALAYQQRRLPVQRQHGRRRRSRDRRRHRLRQGDRRRRRARPRRRSRASPHPLMVKTPKIAPDTARRRHNISRELNLGVSGIMFVETESAAEVQAGINAMRFKSKGGTRPDDVGTAPAILGHDRGAVQAEGRPLAAQSRRRAGQLDDRRKQGRARARPRDRRRSKASACCGPAPARCAACSRRPTRRASACSIRPAGKTPSRRCCRPARSSTCRAAFPSTPADIEMRMKQGFSVFVMNWGDRRLQGGRSRPRRRRAADYFVLNDRPNCEPCGSSCRS